MTYEELALDRHQAQRMENNRAIKVAAVALAEKHGFGNFTVEDLAAAANVSRRTFFNHFGSINEATKAALRDLLLDASETAMAQLTLRAASEPLQSAAKLFEVASQALSQVDVTATIRQSCRVLGDNPRQSAAYGEFFGEVFNAITDDFAQLTDSLAPSVSPFIRHLMVKILLTSVEVCAEEWSRTAMHLPEAEGLSRWRELYANALAEVSSGFNAQPRATAAPASPETL